MKIQVTAIFDIGRTNKKFFLFDSDYREVYSEYIRFEEILDEDGHATDNLEALVNWSKSVFNKMLHSPKFEITALNFSCYGASLVHIDGDGNALTPLYNYMKPLKDEIYDSFYSKYGSENEMARVTGSLKMGMLNTGMHLFWIKHTKPGIFKKIKYSLHLPQYLSYVFTGVPTSEYTSVGCHTMLWDYEKKDYHSWVYEEELDTKLPPIVPTNKTFPVIIEGKTVQMGVGIHDSSSALLPYIRSNTDPFVLISTGTWSISINPFNTKMLSSEDIEDECLFNMRINGSPVKVSRLFLGNEYKIQIKVLSDYFNVPADYHKTIKFNKDTFYEITKDYTPMFRWSSISAENLPEETTIPFDQFEDAYHQLMLELVLLQKRNITAVIGNQNMEKLYIDGGFSDNHVFIQLLSEHFKHMTLSTTASSQGSALGAAIVISQMALKSDFLQKNYSCKKQSPPTLK